jgi:SAM-dependent methyltransferase
MPAPFTQPARTMTDPLGQAITDYQQGNRRAKLWIHNTYGPKEEMPVKAYFRTYPEMPELEHAALQLCKGNILDIGAGAGSHALYLQAAALTVTALEQSPLSCAVMQARGVADIICRDVFSFAGKRYDTLLMLMNGIGLTGSLQGLGRFLQHAYTLLQPGGQLIFDSSDVAYVYDYQLPDPSTYYGEIAYQYQYKNFKSAWFNWLYVDRFTLGSMAAAAGWKHALISEDENGQYLSRLQKV